MLTPQPERAPVRTVEQLRNIFYWGDTTVQDYNGMRSTLTPTRSNELRAALQAVGVDLVRIEPQHTEQLLECRDTWAEADRERLTLAQLLEQNGGNRIGIHVRTLLEQRLFGGYRVVNPQSLPLHSLDSTECHERLPASDLYLSCLDRVEQVSSESGMLDHLNRGYFLERILYAAGAQLRYSELDITDYSVAMQIDLRFAYQIYTDIDPKLELFQKDKYQDTWLSLVPPEPRHCKISALIHTADFESERHFSWRKTKY